MVPYRYVFVNGGMAWEVGSSKNDKYLIVLQRLGLLLSKPTTRILLFAHSVLPESSMMESYPFQLNTCRRWYVINPYDIHWYSNSPVWLIVDSNHVGAISKAAKHA